MRILWDAPEAMGAGDIQALFTGRVPAYTTLMTALARLEKKGDVIRSGESPRKIRFQAARSGEAHAGRTMMSALDAAGDRQAALLQFAGNLADDDLDLLRSAISAKTARKRG